RHPCLRLAKAFAAGIEHIDELRREPCGKRLRAFGSWRRHLSCARLVIQRITSAARSEGSLREMQRSVGAPHPGVPRAWVLTPPTSRYRDDKVAHSKPGALSDAFGWHDASKTSAGAKCWGARAALALRANDGRCRQQ